MDQDSNPSSTKTAEFAITELFADDVSILMESIVNPWGEDDNVVGAFMTDTFAEPVSLKFWQLLVSGAQASELIVDVGAYTGIFSLFAAKLHKARKIVGFEPSAVTYGRYVQNIALNRVYSHIVPCNLAAATAAQTLIMPHVWGHYTLCSGESMNSAAMDHTQPAYGLPLDCLLEPSPASHYLNSASNSIWPFSRVAAIKVDVEGEELAVLEGARRLIARDRPVIIAEALTAEAERALLDFAQSLGYVGRKIGDEWNMALFAADDAGAAHALQQAVDKPAVMRGQRRLHFAI